MKSIHTTHIHLQKKPAVKSSAKPILNNKTDHDTNSDQKSWYPLAFDAQRNRWFKKALQLAGARVVIRAWASFKKWILLLPYCFFNSRG